MTVFVYKNLTTHKWQYGSKAKSTASNTQASELILKNCTFKVMQGGFNYTAKLFALTGKKRRTVHAFACGEITDALPEGGTRIQISYSPFKGPHFYNVETGEPILACDFLHFTADLKCFAIIL